MNILICIFRIVRDLDALEVVRKIQVMGFSHIDDLFTIGL